jgi:hypothetical protein
MPAWKRRCWEAFQPSTVCFTTVRPRGGKYARRIAESAAEPPRPEEPGLGSVAAQHRLFTAVRPRGSRPGLKEPPRPEEPGLGSVAAQHRLFTAVRPRGSRPGLKEPPRPEEPGLGSVAVQHRLFTAVRPCAGDTRGGLPNLLLSKQVGESEVQG